MFQTTLPMFFFTSMWTFTQKDSIQRNYHQERLLSSLKLHPLQTRSGWEAEEWEVWCAPAMGFSTGSWRKSGGFSTVRPRHSMGMWLGWLHTSWSWTHSGRWVQFFLRYFSRFEIDPFHLLQVNGFGLRRNSFLKPKNCHGICTAFFSGFPLMKSAEVGRCREQRRWLSDIFPVIEMELGFIHYPLFR